MQSFILDRHTDPSNPTMKVTQDNKVPIYDSKADAEADLANIEEGAIVATKDTGATEKVVDVVEDGNMNPVTSNAVFDKLQDYLHIWNRTNRTIDTSKTHISYRYTEGIITLEIGDTSDGEISIDFDVNLNQIRLYKFENGSITKTIKFNGTVV